jgi:hypothetical protein
MNKKQQDLFIGQLNEDYIKDELCNHFKLTNLIKLDKFNLMDFRCDNNYFEVKSRSFFHNKYKTTMIGKNKIDWAKSNCKNNLIYFIFIFVDGNFYYKYNSHDNFETTIGGRCDRCFDEIKLYYYIPINKLIKF